MSRRKKWSIPALVIALLGLMVKMAPEIPGLLSRSDRPDLRYLTNEVSAYPVTSHDGQISLDHIQGSQLLSGPVEVVRVVVQNKGETSAKDVTARIIVPVSQDYLGGWLTRSQEPSRVEMLGARTERTFAKLMPGDSVTLDFYFRSANCAYQVDVFDGDGRRAAHYPYVPVQDVGDDMVIIPLRMRWIVAGAVVLMLVVILLTTAGAWRKRPRVPVLAAAAQSQAGGQSLPDASVQPSASSPTPTVDAQETRDRPSRHWTAGGR